jgi:hypothetical protein
MAGCHGAAFLLLIWNTYKQQGQMRELKIPRTIPAYIEVEPDNYADARKATVAQWRKATQFTKDQQGPGHRTIHTMVRIADALGLPDDALLVPRLQAFVTENVVPWRGWLQ